jgi:hypothetical protein
MVLLGYEPGSKAYHLYDPAGGRVHVSRDIVFDENASWNWETTSAPAQGAEPFSMESMSLPVSGRVPEPAATSSSPSPPPASPPLGSLTLTMASAYTPDAALVAASPSPQDGIEIVTPPTFDDALDSDVYDSVPQRYRRIDNILDGGAHPGYAPHALDFDELHAVTIEEPGSFKEAEHAPEWQNAMKEEMDAIVANGTWSLTELPASHRAIGLKWVYKVKRDQLGAIVRHKVRLVAKGYIQHQGVDFEEVFPLVARLESMRLMLAIAVHWNWPVHHMDVKSAFLIGDLQEEVYVAQSPGFVDKDRPGKVLHLHKALYGLRQAPRAWNTKLDAMLSSLGFRRSENEHGVYTRGKAQKRLMVGIYVDDLIITGGDDAELKVFKEDMKRQFQMSDLGTLSYYLSIEVCRGPSGITVSQERYAHKLVEKAGMVGCNPSSTPMEPRLKLLKESTAPPVDATAYRSIVGGLRYLLHTRPDILFSVGYVSRFMEAPTEEHQAAVKRILRYVAGTASLGIHYKRGVRRTLPLLHGYSDSDLASDVNDRKSTGGVIYFLGDGPISWQSCKQMVVALSSCEAEYIAAATATCQGVWLLRLLADLLDVEASAPVLRVDNKSAISLIKNPVHHDRTKHIDIKYRYIRECAERGLIDVQFIGTTEQLGDIFTKALGRLKYDELRSKIGLTKFLSTGNRT